MWGGAMMFSSIIVQREALDLLEEFSIDYEEYDRDTVVADSVQATSALVYHASKAGARIFNCMCAEDVMLDPSGSRVCGLVMNWGPVVRAGMHVDPLVFRAWAVMDSTGHPAEIVSIAARKNGIRLATPTGCIMGERSLSAMEGERLTVENTKEIFPGLFVSGMAANGVSGSFRMGPIFGGMLLSGGKAARLIMEALS
jgi:thiamine thiazole synthase